MAEEEDKKNQQTNQKDPVKKSGDSANAQKPKRKRRRRPRKRKKPQQTDQQKASVQKASADATVPVSEVVSPKEPAPAKEVVDEDIFALDEKVAEEPVLEEPEINTEVEAPVEAVKDEEPTEKFLASDDGDQPIEPVAPPPELPKPAEEPAGPVGWDQLKDAIKKDHVETEEQVAAGVVPVPVAEPTPEQPTPEIPAVVPADISTEPAPEPEVPMASEEHLVADDAAEQQEIIRIIVKYALGGCAVIAIIAGIFLFNIPGTLYNLATGLVDDGETRQEEVTPAQPETRPETPDRTDSDLEDGTGTALISGGQIPKVRKVPASVQTLFDIGLPEVSTSDSDRITTYLQVLNELQNGFETDINQLLDASTKRASTLEIHLRELNGLLAEAQFTYKNLNEEADEIKVEYNKVTTQKDALEESFFVALDKLASNESNLILNDFIDASKKQIVLKADHSAFVKISGMYDIAIRNMEARIKDIEANKQALVKGVKVVDIKGSDLDLIIQEGEL